jgi:protein O-GlcNAcase/histone acetyltransferase
MVNAGLGGEDYLPTIGRELQPEIDVLWTGPEIVSRAIAVAHVREVQARLRRKPILWDNLHANDYDGRRFYCGPYSGRPVELRDEIRGVLSNPNNELPLNAVPLRTLSAFLRCEGAWDARAAYLAAMREWLPVFATTGTPTALEDLILLGDCYYLPHEEGPGAEALHARAAALLSRPCAEWGEDAAAFLQVAARLRELCTTLTTLVHRPLFHALGRRIWDLREELDLLEKFVRARLAAGRDDVPFRSDFHLPGTYRGGVVTRLQRLLVQHPDGTFTPAPVSPDAPGPRGTGRQPGRTR